MSDSGRLAWRRGRGHLLDQEEVAAGRHAWELGLKWWHLLFALLLVGVLTSLWTTQDVPPGGKIAVTVLYAAMAALYVTLGRRAHGCSTPHHAASYLVGTFVLFAPAVVLYGATAFLLAVFCPRFFMLLRMRWAILAVVAFNAVPVVHGLSRSGWAPRAVLGALGWGVILLGFSVAFAYWIRGIIQQSVERAELIEQLEATRAELATVNHEAGVLAERERLAAEIHDTLAQGFTSVLMLLQAAESEMEHDPGESLRHIELAQRTARENLAEARTLVAALAPVRLENASLVEALRRLVDDVGAALGVPADFDVTGDPVTLPAGVEVVLLRAAQEALANVRKHAGASRLAVRLDYGAGTCLEVTDDGRGFDTAGLPQRANGRSREATTTVNGFGLRGMRARVEQVGGRLEVESAFQAGTTTRVTLP